LKFLYIILDATSKGREPRPLCPNSFAVQVIRDFKVPKQFKLLNYTKHMNLG